VGKLVNVVASSGAAMLLNFLTVLGSAFVERVWRELPAHLLESEAGSDRLLRRRNSSSTSRSGSSNIPVIWTVFSIVIIIGAICYFAVVHRRRDRLCLRRSTVRGTGRSKDRPVRVRDIIPS
jgi:hypothetical protein